MITSITIADDDADTREFVRRVLASRNVRIVEISSGAALREALDRDEPLDLLVTDISMPPLSGLAEVASARRRGFAAPTLIITGSDDPQDLQRVAQLGRARLLRKPFGLVDLLGAVAQLMTDARAA